MFTKLEGCEETQGIVAGAGRRDDQTPEEKLRLLVSLLEPLGAETAMPMS